MSLYENERRTTRRHRTQLAIRVLVVITKMTASEDENVLTCIGYTHDISESGIALIISARSISEAFLDRADCTIQVGLTLPTGSIEIKAIPVRFQRVTDGKTDDGEEPSAEQGYLVGMLITEMNDDARSRYVEYLRDILQA
jgi:hypothetical protein